MYREIQHPVVVVVVSHIQRIGCQPEKTTLHGGQSRSWSAGPVQPPNKQDNDIRPTGLETPRTVLSQDK